jgi:LysM repeat protein
MTTHAQCTAYYTVRKGDTLSVIASRFGATVKQLTEWNDIPDPNRIYPDQRLVVMKSDSPRDIYYTVRKGDTLSVIATWFGTSVRQLTQWNDIPDPDRIYPNQRLIVAKVLPDSAA